MKFNIVITNTETGETIINDNTNCIVGAFNKGDGKAQGVCIVEANTIEAVATIKASREAGFKICAAEPKIMLAMLLTDAVNKEEKDGAENE